MVSLGLIILTVLTCFESIHSVTGFSAFDSGLHMECQDFGPMPGRVVTRNDNSTTVSCPEKSNSWTLECVHGSWVGYVGSCKVLASSISKSDLYVILVSVSTVLVVAVAVVCLLINLHARNKLNFDCISRTTRKQLNQRYSMPFEELTLTLDNPRITNKLPQSKISRIRRSAEKSPNYNSHPTLLLPQRCIPTNIAIVNDNATPPTASRFHQSHSLSCMYSGPVETARPCSALPSHQTTKSLRDFQDIYSVIKD